MVEGRLVLIVQRVVGIELEEGRICIVQELDKTKQVSVLACDCRKIVRGLQVLGENRIRNGKDLLAMRANYCVGRTYYRKKKVRTYCERVGSYNIRVEFDILKYSLDIVAKE